MKNNAQAVLLRLAAEAIERHGFVQDQLAVGVLRSDIRPDDPTPPKAREIMPWEDIHRVDGLSCLGALCFAQGGKADTEHPDVRAAEEACTAYLGADGPLEVWNDVAGRTAEQACALLRSVAGEALTL